MLAALAALIVLTRRIETEPPLPNPNGYEDFLKAVTLLEVNPPDWQAMKGDDQREALQKLVATNQPALNLVRAGLMKQCWMPPWEMNATNGAHLNDLAGNKRLAQAFAAAGRLALIEGRTNEAALLALDCIRYGSESARGGVLIDALVGIAIRAIGLRALESAANGMDLASTQKALSELEEVQSRTETADDVFKRERQWARRGRFGPAPVLLQIVQPFLNRKSLGKARQKFIQSEGDLLRMSIQLAAHAYELERGKLPATTGELVPQYLKAIPLDPETGKELLP